MKTIIITQKKSWKDVFSELWDYREIFIFLGWRDILIHYKQTVFGIAWVVLRPLLTVIIFTVIFSRIAGIESQGAPYPLLVFSGMLVWQFFADMLTFGSNCFLANQQLVSKVYFPRLLLPASRLLCSLVDFGIAFGFYLLLSIFRYRYMPSFAILTLPFFIIWLLVVSLAASLFFASLVVCYRDFKHIIPFFIQLGVYVTPVGFSLFIAPSYIQYVLALNPLTGIINGFRYALLGEPLVPVVLVISLFITLLLIVMSLFYFKSVEGTFADKI